ncbi:MAG TPA: uracil phosphoribosyltransferase [Gemmataceae bacterium]|nr:uracil phosphoribosyltransferase [Gemmataceae bacterium]
MPAAIHVSRHPLILHNLATLRDVRTEPPEFRRMVRDLAQLLFYEATADLKLTTGTVRTPLAECASQRIAETVGLVPILRAGLGMAEAMLEMLPSAQVWHLGVYRDHETARPVTYYSKLPARPQIDLAVVVDPMLATGGSAVAALDILKKSGVSRAAFVGLIAAPEGVKALQDAHPDVPIYLAALDTNLDEHKYIVPGLGDAGDRQFATG